MWRASWSSTAAASLASKRLLTLLDDLRCALCKTSFILYEDASHVTSEFHLNSRIHDLECHLMFQWDYYLAIRCRLSNRDSDSSTRLALESIEIYIHEIIQLISSTVLQRPVIAALITQAAKGISTNIDISEYLDIVLPAEVRAEEIRAALLFSWAKVIEGAMATSAHNNASIYASVLLLRLYKTVRSTPCFHGALILRALFWAGINLNQILPSGKPPQVELTLSNPMGHLGASIQAPLCC